VARVTLNVDLGEYPEEPEELYAHATVVNIACGGHAGDEASMRRAIGLAAASGAHIAAHPSYPDRAGFGRVTLAISTADVRRSVQAQCAAIAEVARSLGKIVEAVKLHGALYHDAARSQDLSRAVADGAIAGLGRPATLVGPPGGMLSDAAYALGLPYAREGFADRRYRADGSLVPRPEPGALILDPVACAEQAVRLASSGSVETICAHADTPGAIEIVRAVRAALEHADLLIDPRATVP